MATTTPLPTVMTTVPPGRHTFDRLVRPRLRPEDDGRFVALDIATGEFEIDGDDYTAVMRLKARMPGADIWLARAGSPTAYSIRSRS